MVYYNVPKDKDITFFRYFARCGTIGHTDDQIEAMAKLMHDAHVAGKQVALWHASAIVCGYLDRCNCYPCEQSRRAKSETRSMSR